MTSDFGVFYHLWSHADQPGELLDRLIGEVGVDHILVPAITGPLEQFRVDPPHPPNLFATGGGWHFPPSAAFYRGVAARPRVARWFGKRDALARVAASAAQRGVTLVCRLDLRDCRPVLDHAPHLCMRNAWGDAAPRAGMCVLNPDVRELLLAAVRDLARYAPAAIQLVDWEPDLAADRRNKRPLDHTPAARTLLDLCFCPACRQIALAGGVDPDLVARSVKTHLNHILADELDATRTRLEEDDLLAAYVAVRQQAAATWMREILAHHSEIRWYHERDDSPPALPWSASAACGPVDWIPVLRGRGSEADPPREGLPATAGRVLPVWRPFVSRPDQLVRSVASVARVVRGPIQFDGIEEAPPEVVDWLRQALRYARR